jgi:hypothetical protein
LADRSHALLRDDWPSRVYDRRHLPIPREDEPHLPDNKHVKEKMRQQLQVLRDNGFLEFLDRGRYRLT